LPKKFFVSVGEKKAQVTRVAEKKRGIQREDERGPWEMTVWGDMGGVGGGESLRRNGGTT